MCKTTKYNKFNNTGINWYFVDLLCFCSVLCLLCLWGRLFICALWSPAGKQLTSWLSLVVSNCEFVTFPLVSWVRCGTWMYRFLIFAPLLILQWADGWLWDVHEKVCIFLELQIEISVVLHMWDNSISHTLSGPVGKITNKQPHVSCTLDARLSLTSL